MLALRVWYIPAMRCSEWLVSALGADSKTDWRCSGAAFRNEQMGHCRK